MNELLKTLCTKNGLSGDECEVRDYIKELITPYCKEVIVDNLGNLIAYKEGKKTPDFTIMYDAHTDETGYYVKKIGEDGLIYFDSIGVTAAVTPGKTVTVKATASGEDKFIDGVIGLTPIHMTNAENRSKVPNISEMCIDIGAKNKEDAEKYVAIADSVYFKSEAGDFGNLIKAKALDDRVGCYVLIKMIMSDLENSAWFSFSVQEEVGCRGTQAAAYRIKPDYAVIVEGTTAADIGNVEDTRRVCHVGDGVSLSYADSRTVYDPEFVRKVADAADKEGVKWQFKTYVSGGNDAGNIERTAAGTKVCTLSVPVRYLHSRISAASEEDVESALNFCKAIDKHCF